MALRLLLLVALYVFSNTSFAYPATSIANNCSANISAGASQTPTTGFTTLESACASYSGTRGTVTEITTVGTHTVCGLTSPIKYFRCQMEDSSSPYRWAVQKNSCPSGGTLSGDSCTCTAPQVDNGTACVNPSTQNCQDAGLIYDAVTNTCKSPPSNCEDKQGKIKPLNYLRHYGCTANGDADTCTGNIPLANITFACDVDNCQYNMIKTLSAIKSCQTYPEINNTEIYCTVDSVGTGTACSPVTVVSGSTSTPKSSTPTQTETLNSGGANGGSTQNPNPSNPSTGGGGTNNNSGGGSGPTNQSGPQGGTEQGSGGSGSSSNCDNCATESTLQQVLRAVTNTQGGIAQPDFNAGVTSDDLTNKLVSNDAIQGMFRFQMPAHSRACPTFPINIGFFNYSGVIDSHCTIMADHYQTIRNLGVISWIVMAIIVILGA